MTPAEAEEAIRRMKAGTTFSDDEDDIFSSYTYSDEDQKFHFLEAWTVTGAVLSQAEYTEEEFRNFLLKNCSFRDFTGSSF